jgi:hypothetical protein
MEAHKGPASLRPRCTQSGSSVATIPPLLMYQVYPDKSVTSKARSGELITVFMYTRLQFKVINFYFQSTRKDVKQKHIHHPSLTNEDVIKITVHYGRTEFTGVHSLN